MRSELTGGGNRSDAIYEDVDASAVLVIGPSNFGVSISSWI
jgi:hypothetical protein